VNPYVAVTALIGIVSVLLALPLTPALAELRRKSDAVPLNVIQQHGGEIRHFANSFRAYIKDLEPIMRQCIAQGTNATGTLADGADYMVLAQVDERLMIALQQRDASHPVVLVAAVDLIVPPATTLSQDIYAGGHFFGGEKNSYRAILGQRDIQLGESSQVMRWVHAVGRFWAGRGCRLYGRVSSDSQIRLLSNCFFQRLNAPCIQTGSAEINGEHSQPSPKQTSVSPRTLHEQDLEISSGRRVYGSLLVRGRLVIRSGATLYGSVKSGQDMLVEPGVSIAGSLMSGARMRIGRNCCIHGPVIAERGLQIETGSRCGSVERPTTVSAPCMQLEEGVLVYGSLWAREQGEVVERI
jgi:predicted acyltransferase (DUF342 family)